MSPIGSLVASMCARRNNTGSALTRNQSSTKANVPNTAGHINSSHSKPSAPTPPLPKPSGLGTARNPPHNLQKTPISFFPDSLNLGGVAGEPYDNAVVELMGDGFAKGTVGNYTSALNSFTKFCDENKIAEELRFPTDERVLCAFLTSLNKSISGSTARTIFTALKRWHDMHHVAWNGSERVNLMVRGVNNNTPAESKRAKRLAITPKMMMDLDSVLDHDDPKDSATLACAKAAFFGQARLGELLATSRLKHNPSTHPSRSSIIILLNSNAREIQLPRTKTNQANGESIYLTRQTDPLDPVKALENHLHVNHGLAMSDHLFAYRSSTSRSGRHSLTIEDFMKRVNEIWTRLGYQKVTGHSFRIGGTTTLLRNGVPPDVVKELGRWSSDAFHIYWRDIPEIATRHVEFLQIPETVPETSISTNNGQARRSLRHAAHHDGRNQRQGRPAYKLY